MKTNYVLITSAHNEELHIGNTIDSIGNQTLKPAKWIIVNDRSDDDTKGVLLRYAKDHEFITTINIESSPVHNFASKVYAIHKGVEALDGDYEYIGILDADITLPRDYYMKVLEKFENNLKLGIAGGVLFDIVGGKRINRSSGLWSVSGGVQLFRKQCFKDIGGLVAIKGGGEDAVAEIAARMNGWIVQSFPDITGDHHRRTGRTKLGAVNAQMQFGLRDYYLGCDLIFEVCKCLKRAADHPFLIGAILRFFSYIINSVAHTKRPIPATYVSFNRKQQRDVLHDEIKKCFKKNKD